MEYREERRIGRVRHIIVRGSVDVLFRQSDRPAMMVTGGDAEAVRSVITSFIGDKMIIDREGLNFCHIGDKVNIFGTGGFQTFVNGVMTSPFRQEQAGVEIMLPGLLTLTLQGSSGAVLSGLERPDLKIEIQGSGTVEGTGRVGDLEIIVMGSGNVDASALLAANGIFRVSGTGNISAAVQSDVYAEVSGIGDIAVYGNPLGRRRERVTGGRIRNVFPALTRDVLCVIVIQ